MIMHHTTFLEQRDKGSVLYYPIHSLRDMDSYFQTVHRIGEPTNDEIVEVEIPNDASLCDQLLALLREQDLRDFSQFITSKIVWLSPYLFFIDSQGPYNFAFFERHDCNFLFDIMCGPSRQYPRDLAISVCLYRDNTQPTIQQEALDTLLQLLSSLQPKALGVYGNLGQAVDGNPHQFPFTAGALNAFLRGSSSLIRLHISHFQLSQPQFDALSTTSIPNLRLGYVELPLDQTFPVKLKAGLFELDVGNCRNSCLWALSNESDLLSMVVRTRQTLPTPLIGMGQEAFPATNKMESLIHILATVQPINLCMKVHWFTMPAVWMQFCQAMITHPTLKVIRLSEFFPQIRADERKRLCSQAVLSLVRSNQRLQQVDIPIDCRDARIWSAHIDPLLGLNRLRPRLAALVGDKKMENRRSALGKAIFTHRFQENQLYYLLRDTQNILFE